MMKILGIESAALVASVAIIDEDVTIAEYTTNFKKTHSETLLPMLDEIGFDEFLFDDAVILIEWSTLIKEALPKDVIRVVISKNLEKGFDYREVAVEGMDDEYFRN